MTRVLYLVYWGALEPLGQSLVVPAVKKLAANGVALSLVTFEKAADLADRGAVSKLRRDFDRAGIDWRPLCYHKRPKWPATFFDALMALLLALRLRLSARFDVVHARTFVAGPIGWLIARLIGAAFVYHNEGFYPDEQVDGGVWRAGSRVHRFARALEGFLYDHADGLIVLSERAKAVLLGRRAIRRKRTRIIVVPSAVDLDAFRQGRRSAGPRREVSLVYLGSVGLRYRLDEAGRFVAVVRRLKPATYLTVVSRAERALVERMLDASGLPRDAWCLKTLPHAAIPVELRRHDAGLFFLTQGLSEHGCSPTKIGEYWASGLPVITTPNVSDTEALIRRRNVGVIVQPEPTSHETGARQLLSLLADPKHRRRCRGAAREAYSLDEACERQRRLYRRIGRGE